MFTLSFYRTLAVEYKGGGDEFLSVLPRAAEMVLAIAVIDLLASLDGVLGDKVGLIMSSSILIIYLVTLLCGPC